MDVPQEKTKVPGIETDTGTLESEMKTALKEGNFTGVKTAYEKLVKVDPENRRADRIMAKAEKLEEKVEKKARLAKAKEYKTMLKHLLKEKEVDQMEALAKEFAAFDPESRHAQKWLLRSERLKAKLGLSDKPAFALEPRAATPMVFPTRSVSPPAAVAPAVTVPVTSPAPAPVKAAPAPESGFKGNLFTKMFSKKEDETTQKSIIDTIVAKTEKQEEKKPEVKKVEVTEKDLDEEEKPKKLTDGARLLTFSKIFFNFTAIFVVVSAIFLYVEWIDKQNTVLSVVGIEENTGGKLHGASIELGAQKKKETELNKEIELYKTGYDDQAVKTVESIIAERINWPDIFTKIKEVTNSVYELNDFFKYIEYNNYAFDAEKHTIRVTGNLSDPLGRNLTKLVELEEAFKYHPKDRNNPDDTTRSYFIGFKEFTSFSKSLDKDTGRYNSTFQLSFELNK